MANTSDPAAPTRSPLNRELILQAAVALADRSGLGSLSMRRLGAELGVEAMSLYNHVANKDEILDGMIDRIMDEIDVPADGIDWKRAMRGRAISAHEVLLRHTWAPALIESRVTSGAARFRHCDAVIGTLRGAGFPIETAYHAFLTLDSYIYGFTQQEVNWPFEREERPEMVEGLAPQILAGEYPHLVEMMEYVLDAGTGGDERGDAGPYETEFAFGLDLILDGLERILNTT